MVRKKQSSTPSSTTSDLSDDPDTEEALKGFDFLASPDELDGSRSGEDSGEWGETGGHFLMTGFQSYVNDCGRMRVFRFKFKPNTRSVQWSGGINSRRYLPHEREQHDHLFGLSSIPEPTLIYQQKV